MSTWVGEGAGGLWGVSPGRIHLGGHAIRICGRADASECGFGLLPNQRASYRDWATRWREIRGQGRALELRESWRERARGIRARRDAERADTTRADYS